MVLGTFMRKEKEEGVQQNKAGERARPSPRVLFFYIFHIITFIAPKTPTKYVTQTLTKLKYHFYLCPIVASFSPFWTHAKPQMDAPWMQKGKK